MTEPDTAALVETVRVIIEALVSGDYPLDGVTVNDALAALDALAQRLADAERDLQLVRKRNADGIEERARLDTAYQASVAAAEARARAEDVLRHIATWQPDGLSDAELVTLFRDQAGAALTPTEEPEHV